jgi:endonuclease/exonuclease/phosphatase family metal-dependent hydrolase
LAVGEIDAPLRVMSFNIRHGAGIGRCLDLARTARVIRAARVDVAGLQELDRHFGARSDFLDEAEWLAGRLGMQVVYGANVDLDPAEPTQERRQFGNALLSVHPILSWDNTFLPRLGDTEQRGLLRADVDVRGTPWRIFVTHLQNTDAAERLVQARAIVEIIGTPASPTVLMGDLNATPDCPEIRVLTDHLTDTWREAHPRRHGATYPSPFPARRIDYILRSAHLETRSAGRLTSVGARIASDHLPVLADLAPDP